MHCIPGCRDKDFHGRSSSSIAGLAVPFPFWELSSSVELSRILAWIQNIIRFSFSEYIWRFSCANGIRSGSGKPKRETNRTATRRYRGILQYGIIEGFVQTRHNFQAAAECCLCLTFKFLTEYLLWGELWGIQFHPMSDMTHVRY